MRSGGKYLRRRQVGGKMSGEVTVVQKIHHLLLT